MPVIREKVHRESNIILLIQGAHPLKTHHKQINKITWKTIHDIWSPN
jgi:hypothetical protein